LRSLALHLRNYPGRQSRTAYLNSGEYDSMNGDSFAKKLLGNRSFFSWIFGTFFSDSTNTSGLLAIGLVASVIYLYIKNGQVADRMLDAVFIIVGFYFGGATARKQDEKAEP
jgi:hypothetical protein